MEIAPTEPERHCLGCGYSLYGLPAHRCPECGRAFDPNNPESYGPQEGLDPLRCARASQIIGQIVLACAIALLIVAAYVDLRLADGLSAFGYFVLACGCSAVGIVAFLVAAWNDPRRREKAILWCAVALAGPTLWWVSVPPISARLDQTRRNTTILTIQGLVMDIEKLRSRIGRLPQDANELVKLTGKAMPRSAWGDPIKYARARKDPVNYSIDCLTEGFAAMIYQYDSSKPNQGVIVFPF